jgi:hypothetical protein
MQNIFYSIGAKLDTVIVRVFEIENNWQIVVREKQKTKQYDGKRYEAKNLENVKCYKC